MEKIYKNHILALISKIQKKANAFIENRLHENNIHDLLVSHGSILSVLYKSQGPLKISDITERVKRTKSTVTELIVKLENNGYVKKIPCHEDMRITYISLTEKALELRPLFQKISEEMINLIYKGLTQEEIENYVLLNEKIINNME